MRWMSSISFISGLWILNFYFSNSMSKLNLMPYLCLFYVCSISLISFRLSTCVDILTFRNWPRLSVPCDYLASFSVLFCVRKFFLRQRLKLWTSGFNWPVIEFLLVSNTCYVVTSNLFKFFFTIKVLACGGLSLKIVLFTIFILLLLGCSVCPSEVLSGLLLLLKCGLGNSVLD